MEYADEQMAKNGYHTKYKVHKVLIWGLTNLFANEQKSRNSSHASKLVPTQQDGFGPASDLFYHKNEIE